MKILYIHNSYSEKTPTGEEYASRELVGLLEEHGHEVRWMKANSDDAREHRFGPVKALFMGIYNPKSAKELQHILDEYKPDVVQVQNIYPLISSSIFHPLKECRVPVVMRCPNYRLFCPTGLSLDPQGNVCEDCWNGSLHEWNCVRKNCMKSWARSIGYAVRNSYNRMWRKILDGVDVFIVQSDFQKRKFIGQGIPKDSIVIVPGISPNVSLPRDMKKGDKVCFVGRVSPEKGIYEFIEAARRNPTIPFEVAGFFDSNFVMPSDVPSNLKFVGFLKGADLDKFYMESRIIVVPSKWYEGFPNVILRAFMFERPVITTNIGAMQSIVKSKYNGLLVELGDVDDLSNAIGELYNDLTLCEQYGKAGCHEAHTAYSRERVYEHLMNAYKMAIQKKQRGKKRVKRKIFLENSWRCQNKNVFLQLLKRTTLIS